MAFRTSVHCFFIISKNWRKFRRKTILPPRRQCPRHRRHHPHPLQPQHHRPRPFRSQLAPKPKQEGLLLWVTLSGKSQEIFQSTYFFVVFTIVVTSTWWSVVIGQLAQIQPELISFFELPFLTNRFLRVCSMILRVRSCRSVSLMFIFFSFWRCARTYKGKLSPKYKVIIEKQKFSTSHVLMK